MYVSLHVKVLVLLFDSHNGNLTNLCKNSKCDFYDYPSSGNRVVETDSLTDGLTDRLVVKLIFAFRNCFVDAPKNVGVWDPRALCMRVCRRGGLQLLNRMTIFHEI